MALSSARPDQLIRKADRIKRFLRELREIPLISLCKIQFVKIRGISVKPSGPPLAFIIRASHRNVAGLAALAAGCHRRGSGTAATVFTSVINFSFACFATLRLCVKSVSPYLTGPGGAGVTVSDATAQMFDPADPDRPVKVFLQEYHP
jgi:hypothetical protein